jgi:hypothetical protein
MIRFKKNRPWTPADVEAFTRLWSEGVSMQDCANELRRSFQAIEKARARYGLPIREKRGRTKGVKWSNKNSTTLVHSKGGPAVGEHSSAMKRETDSQARLWQKLLARASA